MSNNSLTSKRTIGNIFKVAGSNILKMLAGILVGFLLPRIIGVTDYGYYKTFTLYASYVGLFALGITDGIYLKYGGKSYEELDKSQFRFYSMFYFILEIISAVVVALISLVFLKDEIRYIFICLAVFLIFHNITGYFQIISQITGRFNELSLRTLIQSIFTALSVFGLWVVYHFSNKIITYRLYTVIYISITSALALWYIFTYRDIVFGKQGKRNFKDIGEFIKIGFPLLIANLCTSLILALDRQFVSLLFNTETYAVYAFAYNMLSLITTALSAISTVIYPTLKQTDENTLKNNYSNLIKVILIIVFTCLIVYFPLCWFVGWYLPKYTDSLPIFRIILPGLAINSAVTIVMHNYYKTMGKETNFFIKCIIVLVLSAVANYTAYAIFKTTYAISIASIIVMLIWYVLIESYFIRRHKVKWVKNFTYMILMATGFYLITWWNIWWASMLVYIAFLALMTFVFYWKDLKAIFRKLFKKKGKEEEV
ncbi:MAG: oligosaccharide flippase family protein [Candidatus Coproplasma sp.]